MRKSDNMDHIVFDIGNVLIDWNPERPFKRLIPDEQHRALFLTEICNQAWNIEQDHGRSWADAEEALIAVYPEWEELILAYRKHWIETITGPEPGGFELRDELKADGKEYFNIKENNIERARRYTSSEVIKETNVVQGDQDYS